MCGFVQSAQLQKAGRRRKLLGQSASANGSGGLSVARREAGEFHATGISNATAGDLTVCQTSLRESRGERPYVDTEADRGAFPWGKAPDRTGQRGERLE